VFTLAAAIFDLLKTLPAGLQTSLHLDLVIGFARSILPWFDLNLGWVVPAIAGLLVGLIIRKIKDR
jgi:LIVCS family branched-chain amino acid:cation transporter